MTEGLPPMRRPKERRTHPDGTAAAVGVAIRLLVLVGGVLLLDQPRWMLVTYAVLVLVAAAVWWWRDAR